MADEREHLATDHPPETAQPDVAPSAPAPALGAGPWLDHSTAAAPRAAFVLAAQRGQGNAWVARAILQRQEDGDEGDRAAQQAPAGLIVEDGTDPAPGQMTRSAFLGQLETDATAAAEEALDGTLWALAAGTGVHEWIAPYRERDAPGLESAVKKKVPAAAGAADAAAMITAVCEAVRTGISERLESEELDEAGEEENVLEGEEPPPFSLQDLPGAQVAAEVADIMFKRRPDAPSAPADPRAVQRRLGRGEALDSGVRSRMEPLLGADLGRVRVHTDGAGAQVAGELGARALTTGRHVAFGAGEYAPGTPVGDALLAHELAHVAQQEGGGPAATGGEAALEQDADASAAGAVASLYAGDKAAVGGLQRRPRLRDGLALRRCTGDAKKPKPKEEKKTADVPEYKDEPMPADPKAVYDRKLPEGINRLKVNFGRAESHAYDEELWERVKTPAAVRQEEMLRLKPSVKPSVGIDALYARLDKWSLDCAQFVQVAHLYALRHALGSTEFNKRVGSVQFLIRAEGDSTLLEGNKYWRRVSPDSPFHRYPEDKEVPDTAEQLLAAAPVGSRVMWTNQLAPPNTSFEHENTLKTGPNSFAAHGFKDKTIFTREDLEDALAKKANPEADRQWAHDHVFIQLVEVYKVQQNLTAQ